MQKKLTILMAVAFIAIACFVPTVSAAEYFEVPQEVQQIQSIDYSAIGAAYAVGMPGLAVLGLYAVDNGSSFDAGGEETQAKAQAASWSEVKALFGKRKND